MLWQRFTLRIFLAAVTLLSNGVQWSVGLPVVDKGVFVITGVKTCGAGQGYCVLGGECTVDKEFAPDKNNGHCDGLRKAFTPRAYFVCCEYVDQGTGKSTTTTTTTPAPPKPGTGAQSTEASQEENDSVQSPESKESSESIEKVGVPSSEESDNDDKDAPPPSSTTPAVTSAPLSSTEPDPQPDSEHVAHDSHDAVDTPVQVHDTVPVSTSAPVTSDPLTEPTTGTMVPVSLVTTDKPVEKTTMDALNDSPVSIPESVPVSTTGAPISTTTTVLSETSTLVEQRNASGSVEESKPENSVKNHVGVSEKPKVDEPHTTISYSEKTEISVEESVRLHVKQCGVKLTSSRIDASRLASQAMSGMSSSCWTGAIVRSPMAMSMQADPGSFICAGALIHPNVLLTTATCVSRLFSQDLKLFKVALGSSHLLHPAHGPTPDADYRDIKELVIHEEYVVDGHMRFNDIALVMLSEAADMSKACTLCLPDVDSDFRGRDCIVTGYSHPSDSSALESDGILHEAEQRIEYQPTCEMVLTNFTQHSFRTEKDLEGLLCASGKYSAEACFSPRDAGSPLACSENGIYVLAGSFSSGFHCGTPEMPVLYTDISKQMNWVNKNLMKTVMVF